MKNLLIIFLALLFAAPLFGQADVLRFEDRVYMKDGSFLKGEIIEENQWGVIIKMMGVSAELSLPSDAIKNIIHDDEKGFFFSNGKRLNLEGRYLAYKFSSAWGASEFNEHFKGMHFQISGGKRLGPKLAIGGGTGFDFQAGPNWETYTFAPVFAEVIGTPITKPWSPYYRMALGYNIPLQIGPDWEGANRKYSGGILVQPSVGIRIAKKKKSSLLLEVGYKFQNTTAKRVSRNWQGDGNRETIQKINFKRLEFSIGSIF